MDAQLSFEEALGLAIHVRDALGARFDELAEHLESSRTGEAASLLREIAARQRETSSSLREVAHESPIQPVSHLPFELPDYSTIRAHMTAHQALHIAVESEKAVYDWFGALMHQATETGVRRLFDDLRGEAGVWRDRLERDLAGLNADEVDPALFADEPVAN